MHSFCTKDLTKKDEEDSAIGAGAAESFLLVIPCHVFPCFEMKDADIDLAPPLPDPSAAAPCCSVLCLLLIAIRLTRSHTGDCLITRSSPCVHQ